MARLGIAVAGLAALVMVVGGPVSDLLEGLACQLDSPGPISLDQAYGITLALVASLFVIFAVVVAYWSGSRGLRAAAAVALGLPFTFGFIWLFSVFMSRLYDANIFDSATLAHPSLLLQYINSLLYAGFHLTVVVILGNVLRPQATDASLPAAAQESSA